MNKAVSQYLKAIDRALCCDRQTKKAILKTLQARLHETDAAEAPLSFEMLCARFGAPEALAESYLEIAEPAPLQRAAKHRRGIWIAVVAVLLAALTIWAVTVFSLWQEGRQNVNGFTVDILSDGAAVQTEDVRYE